VPEVEAVRRMLEAQVLGRRIASTRLSGHRLRTAVPRALPRRLAGRVLERVERRGKYLLIGLDAELTLLSHLGMSGRWLFFPEEPSRRPPHVHVRIGFADGAALWFQDPRRFGLLRLGPPPQPGRDPPVARLGPGPVAEPPPP